MVLLLSIVVVGEEIPRTGIIETSHLSEIGPTTSILARHERLERISCRRVECTGKSI